MTTGQWVGVVVEVAVLGAAFWLTDRWVGRALGGRSLKLLWAAFFVKVAVPVGLVSLPWSLPVSFPAATAPSSLSFPSRSEPIAPMVTQGWHPGPASVGITVPWDLVGWALLLAPALVLLSWLAVQVLGARAKIETLVEIRGPLATKAGALARQVGFRGPLRLLRAADGSSPASWGFFRPAILLPPGWENQFPEAEQEQILVHELVHLKHHDSLLWLAVQAMTCMYWYHPLVWVARGRLLSAIEAGCDERVLALSAGGTRTVYARALLRTLELGAGTSLAPGARAAAADKEQLKRRIRMIQEFRPRSRTGMSVLALVFLAAVSLVPAVGAPEAATRIIDDIHRPFVDDPAVKGVWKAVDFVDTPADFVLGKTSWQGPLYLKSLTFYPNGQLGAQATEDLPTGPLPWFSWTKGVVMHQNDVTASAYTIEWRGFFTDVMFYEWKSGDYIFRHEKPKYYVLVRG